jgi:hypothetical protein
MLLAMLVGFGYYYLIKIDISDPYITYENGSREAINSPLHIHIGISKNPKQVFLKIRWKCYVTAIVSKDTVIPFFG